MIKVHIKTNEELEQVKKTALRILNILPNDSNEALIILIFLLEQIESVSGKKILDYKMINEMIRNGGKQNEK